MAKLVEIIRIGKRFARVIVDGTELSGVCKVSTSVHPHEPDRVIIELYTDKFVIKNEGDE